MRPVGVIRDGTLILSDTLEALQEKHVRRLPWSSPNRRMRTFFPGLSGVQKESQQGTTVIALVQDNLAGALIEAARYTVVDIEYQDDASKTLSPVITTPERKRCCGIFCLRLCAISASPFWPTGLALVRWRYSLSRYIPHSQRPARIWRKPWRTCRMPIRPSPAACSH